MSVLATFYASRHERLDEAFDLARRADQLQPGTLAWQLNLARVLLAMGRVDEARDIGERALARAETDAEKEAVRSLLDAVRRSSPSQS